MKRLLWTAPLLALLGGCGDDAPPADQTLTIKYLRHDNGPYAKADDDFFATYEKANPKVDIKVTEVRYPTLTASLIADLKRDQLNYDLVIVPPSFVCGFADNILDVPADVITLDAAKSTFFEAPLAGSVCGGKLKGLPEEYNLEYGGVVVNKTKYEAKFNKAPAWSTWADFIKDAAALTEYQGDVPKANGLDIDNGWPQPVKHIFLSLILQNGGKYWNGEGEAFDASKGHTFNFTSDAAKKSLTEMVKWIATDKVMFPQQLVPSTGTFVTVRLAGGSSEYGWKDPNQPLSLMGYAGTWALANTVGQLKPENLSLIHI